MAEDSLLFLLRRLAPRARRDVALRWAGEVVDRLPADPRTRRLRLILTDAHLADNNPHLLHRAWVQVGALRTPQEAPLWFWARTCVRNACDPHGPLSPTIVGHVALAARQVAATLAGPDDQAVYAACADTDSAHRRWVTDLLTGRVAA